MNQKILEVQSLRKYYGKQDTVTKAIDGLTFQVMEGEFIGIMGSSGSGKTTLLNCIATTICPTEGKILLKGKNIGDFKGEQLADYRGSRIGYLFQNYELLDNLTGRENIMLPLAIHNVKEQDGVDQIERLAQFLEIEDVLSKFPSQMSGGQKQRVAAARAMILNPDIVLADEPTGALDSKNAKILMNKLSDLNQKQKVTILMVTHDSNAASYCSRILFIQDGMIFHELRKKIPEETQQEFYERIISVMAQLGGGSANVL
ncbi:ABC transporter ATP-binding protein [Anaerosacchariphilus polymeriproducens]|uniref:ABC transporter ATP-binding protein n=1 Tax=Anaerosacchariphilus polymeriproducens TaxID=1812858 RepID=A0A371AVN0_9FIRM|nr:ABC transporter ATP-binding protein [Anaerosacchariphilus polymeriproducens]RDU23638.1 ABC transporter ATP-binding protein [Anaerosacchariphilus polymeriproducens]